MIVTRLRAVVAGILVVLASLVATAPVSAVVGPATVMADMPSAVPAGHLWAFNDFFPRTVSVPTGTDLQFINQGFHTFTVLPAGTSAATDRHTNGVAQTRRTPLRTPTARPMPSSTTRHSHRRRRPVDPRPIRASSTGPVS